MTETQKKLKEYWEELLNETDHTAKHGDHSSHSGYFNPESGCGEPPYTGEGLSAEEDLKEWEEFMNDPLAMFDWCFAENMPELVKLAFEKWLEIRVYSWHELSTFHGFMKQPLIVKIALVEKFARDFYKVATGKDFEVVSL